MKACVLLLVLLLASLAHADDDEPQPAEQEPGIYAYEKEWRWCWCLTPASETWQCRRVRTNISCWAYKGIEYPSCREPRKDSKRAKERRCWVEQRRSAQRELP